MPQVRRMTEESRAQSVRSAFKQVVEAVWPLWDGATGPQKSSMLNVIETWDFAEPLPTVARENALFAWCVLLTMSIAYLWIKIVGRD